MIRHVVTIVALVTAVFAPTAWAADVEGKVQSVDAGEGTVTLDNGMKIWLSDGAEVKEGTEVRISYEEKDGKPVATSVETK